MLFRIWDQSEDIEVLARPYYRGSSQGLFGVDILTEVDSLTSRISLIQIQTEPQGKDLTFSVDGTACINDTSLYLYEDSTATVVVDSLQAPDALPVGERFQFEDYTYDGSVVATRTLAYTVPSSVDTIHINFDKQFLLTTAENPDAGGDISPAPPGAWYDSSAVANVNAAANAGYQWVSWGGDVAPGSPNPTNVVMDSPKSVTANFGQEFQITVKTDPPGQEFIADGTPYTNSYTFSTI